MPVERVPGFWDALGAGVNQGIERQREDARLKMQQDQANAGLMAQLFGAGAVDSSSLQGALAPTGVQATVIPGKAERRKKALETPGGIEAMDDESRRDLGFQTRTEKKVDASQGAQADFATKRADAMNRFAAGEKLNEVDSQITGFATQQDRELDRLGKMDPFLNQVGERYVAGSILKMPGGRIDPRGAQIVSEKAYADYVANRAQSGLGTMTPQEIEYTKSYFDRATQNALIAQHKLDIDEYDAKSRRAAANAQGARAEQDRPMQWFRTINTAEAQIRQQKADLLKANPALIMAKDNPAFATNPVLAGPLKIYEELERKEEAYRQAQTGLAGGVMPANLQELIGQAQADASGPSAPVGGAKVVPPPGAPRQGGAPAPQPAAVDQGKVGQALQLLKGGGTMAQLEAAAAQGAFTAAEVAEIKKRAANRPKQSSK